MGKFDRYDYDEDDWFNFTPGCDPSRGPKHCCEHERDRRNCRSYVKVFASHVDAFIKDYQKGSTWIPHVKAVTFYGEERVDKKDENRLIKVPTVTVGRLEDIVCEDVLAPENQDKIFSGLCSVWNLISEWDIKKPITLGISGRYFRSNDKCLTDLAHQKNIERLACGKATFANPFDVLNMAKRLPELRALRLQVRHMSKDMRNELANDMRTWKTTLPKLSGLTLVGDKDAHSRGDERKLEDMREDGVDLLCRELRALAQQHGFLGLGLEFVPISAELFEDTQNPGAEMRWPTLRVLSLRVHEMSSTGTWLFSKDPADKKSGLGYVEDKKAKTIHFGKFFRKTIAVEKEIGPLAELFERTCTTEKMPYVSEDSKMTYGKDVNGPIKAYRKEEDQSSVEWLIRNGTPYWESESESE
ncbi:unnamed protein product [Clonostachys byssicola]|uniref:Uncharacterized protein n=1 Tax=Clonostachys byssicola TaxID=160290 RepID=A0A9N9UAE7_9HYPO|nr:unnamed protein product [Clonostachys byssicola]